jgi:hypothetical protein
MNAPAARNLGRLVLPSAQWLSLAQLRAVELSSLGDRDGERNRLHKISDGSSEGLLHHMLTKWLSFSTVSLIQAE